MICNSMYGDIVEKEDGSIRSYEVSFVANLLDNFVRVGDDVRSESPKKNKLFDKAELHSSSGNIKDDSQIFYPDNKENDVDKVSLKSLQIDIFSSRQRQRQS